MYLVKLIPNDSFKLFKTKQQASSEGSSMPRSAQLKQSHLKRVKTVFAGAAQTSLQCCADGGERSLCYISAGVTLSPGETPDFSIKSQRVGHSGESFVWGLITPGRSALYITFD